MTTAEATIVGFAGGLLAAFLSALGAWKTGLLHLGEMQKAHRLNIEKATSKVGCDVRIAEVNVLGALYSPQLVVHFHIYNDGELASSNVNGYWQLVSAATTTKFPKRPVQRDHLAQNNPFSDELSIPESVNWNRDGVILRVEVSLTYISQPSNSEGRYNSSYEYDPASRAMRRCAT